MIVYTKYSNDRRPELQIRTTIFKDEEGSMRVEKAAACPEALPHIRKMIKSGETLDRLYEKSKFRANRRRLTASGCAEFEYVAGRTLDEKAGELTKDPERLTLFLREYLTAVSALSDTSFVMTEEFKAVFGQETAFEKEPAMSCANIDMLLANIILHEGWQVIDYEWTFDFPVPTAYILWRVIHYFFSGKGEALKPIEEALLEEYRLTGRLDVCERMETAFQSYVDGRHKALRHLYPDISPGLMRLHGNLNQAMEGDKTFDITVSDKAGGDGRRWQSLPDGTLTADIPSGGMETLYIRFTDMPMVVHILTLTADGSPLPEGRLQGGPLVMNDKDLLMAAGDHTLRVKLGGSCLLLHLELKAELLHPRMVVPTAEIGAMIYEEQRTWAAKESRYLAEIAELKERIRRDEDILELRSNATIELGETRVVKNYRKLRLKMGRTDPLEQLRPHLDPEKSEIIYHVDGVSRHKTYISLNGWVYNPVYKREKIRFCSGDGTPLAADIQRKLRPDVTALFGIEPWRMVGFEASFDYARLKKLPLIMEIEDPRGYFAVRIDELSETLKKKPEENPSPEGEDTETYDDFFQKSRPGEAELSRQRSESFEVNPLISICIPLYETPENYLAALIDSLLAQSYDRFEICLADGSADAGLGGFLEKRYPGEKRLRYRHLEKNRGIAENTNAAMTMAAGDFLLLADHDDELSPEALWEIVKAINLSPDTDIVYTDEDKLTADGTAHFDPNFKPDFDWEYLRSTNYICHIFCVRKSLADEAGGERDGFEGAQDYDFILRCCEKARVIYHVPRVLYFWRAGASSTALDPTLKGYARESTRRALQSHYDRCGIRAKAAFIEGGDGYLRTVPLMEREPLVSVILAPANGGKDKDAEERLRQSLAGLDYQKMEILVSEKTPRALREAAGQAKGEYLVFMDGNSCPEGTGWLRELLSVMMRDKAGAAGGKRLRSDGLVESVGLVCGRDGSLLPAYRGEADDIRRHYGRTAVVHEVSALPLDGMITEKALFEKAGFFDENFAGDRMAADYCLRLRKMGREVIADPHAVMKSASGEEEMACGAEEAENMKKAFALKWQESLDKGDPFQSPHLDPESGKMIKE